MTEKVPLSNSYKALLAVEFAYIAGLAWLFSGFVPSSGHGSNGGGGGDVYLDGGLHVQTPSTDKTLVPTLQQGVPVIMQVDGVSVTKPDGSKIVIPQVGQAPALLGIPLQQWDYIEVYIVTGDNTGAVISHQPDAPSAVAAYYQFQADYDKLFAQGLLKVARIVGLRFHYNSIVGSFLARGASGGPQ